MMCRMGRASKSVVRLIKETKMDFTKIDFSKFDASKMFDVDATLTKMEENTKTATGYIYDAKARDLAQTITAAGFEFARAQTAAAKAFGEAVKKAVQI